MNLPPPSPPKRRGRPPLGEDLRRQFWAARYPELRAWLLDRYVAGTRQSEIAAELGVTREMVRQYLNLALSPGNWSRISDSHRRAFGSPKHRTMPQRCKVCGDGVPPSRSAFCSNHHYDLWITLRLTLPKYHEVHRLNIAQWQLRNPDHPSANPISTRHAQRVVAGTAKRRDRWFVKGSLCYLAAREVYDLGGPLFLELHPRLREQIYNDVAREQRVAALTEYLRASP